MPFLLFWVSFENSAVTLLNLLINVTCQVSLATYNTLTLFYIFIVFNHNMTWGGSFLSYLVFLKLSEPGSPLFDFFYPSYYCCAWGMLWHLQNFLYHSWVHCLHHFPLSSSLHLRIVSTSLIFPFYTWVPNIPIISTPLNSFHMSSPFPLISTPRQDCFILLSSVYEKMFCLFVCSYTGSFIMTFPCIYVL
jgi:hypothetical protein